MHLFLHLIQHGRSHKAPSYIISTPEALQEHYERAQRLDAETEFSPPKMGNFMWKPEAMRVDKGTKGVIPDLGKSHGLLRSFDDKEEVEMNFPLNGNLTHKSYKDRWENLKKSGVATGEDPSLAASSQAAQPQVSSRSGLSC